MVDLNSLLEGYTQQRLPFLALRTRLESERLQIDVQYTQNEDHEPSTSIDQDWLRAAIIRLINAYADSSDLLLVELERNQGDVSVVRIKLDQSISRKDAKEKINRLRNDQRQACSSQHLTKTALQLGMNLSEDQSPALITLGPYTFLQQNPDWYPRKGVSVLFNISNKSISIVADKSILAKENAFILAKQIWQLYEEMIKNPNERFEVLELSTNDLLSQYESEYDSNEAHLPIKWLQMNAINRPNAIAHELCDEPDSREVRFLTFLELEERSNQMANWLVEKFKIQRGNPVGVMRKRDENFYIAMAAILKCGGCYLPIDQDLPKERKEYIVQDSNAVLLLTDFNGSQIEIAGKVCINLDDDSARQEIHQFPSTQPAIQVNLDDLAYILYTSGTSGNPKGCLLMHRGLYWAIKMFVQIPKSITDPENDKRLAMAAVAFDVHVSEIVQTWAIGIRLVSVGSRMSLLADLQGTIERFQITHIGMVPSMIEATLTNSPSELPLKYITSGGEKINDNVLNTWAANPNILFANLYGPTEATIGCTARIIRGTDEPKEDIGYAFNGSAAYIVNKDLNIVPKGVAGELIIEGPLVARGYLNLPQVTAKSFIKWPRKGCRAYRTGDLVRMNFDGSLSIHGRIDSQIKLRGVRIESEGVSAVISQASKEPKFDAVSVICKHESIGNAEILVTFITPKTQGKKATSANKRRGKAELMELKDVQVIETLRRASIQGLASYMRPSHIIPLTFFPLSHNGKVDTKPLIKLFSETSMTRLLKVQGLGNDDEHTKRDIVKPVNELEETLVQAISEIIGVQESSISTRGNLLEIGLGSMNCARLTAVIRKRTGTKVNVADVLACNTIAESAKMIEEKQNKESKEGSSSMWNLQKFQSDKETLVRQSFNGAYTVEGLYPPLPVQAGVIFHSMQNKTGYVQHFRYHIEKNFTNEDIRKAWIKVQKVLDILRTVFILDEGELIQVVLNPDSCQIPLTTRKVDQDDLKDKEILDRISTSINEEFKSPMFAITILESMDERVMTVSFSHTIYDAFSVRSIMSKFDQALSDKDILSENYLSMSSLVDQLYTVPEQEHISYWQSCLKGPLQDRFESAWQPLRRRKNESARRMSTPIDFGFEDVQKRCGQIGVTIQTFYNVIFSLSARSIFSHWQKYALFGNVRSGRNLPLNGIEDASFPLVNIVPCLIDFTNVESISQLMSSSHSSWIDSIEHENIALSKIQAWLKTRDIVECLFSCRIEADGDRSNAYKNVKHLSTSNMDPEFPLAIEVLINQMGDSMELRIAHSPLSISAEQVDEIVRQMQTNIRKIMGGENIKLSSIENGAVSLKGQTIDSKEDGTQRDDALINSVREAVATFLKQDIEVIQPETSFISLGMTSLRAVALCHSLAKKQNIHVDPIEVVQGDNVISIVKALSKNDKKEEEERSRAEKQWKLTKEELEELGNIQLDKNDQIDLAPCTPLQAGMLSQTIASEGKLYVHGFVMKLKAPEDESTIKHVLSIWSKIHAEYGILKTSFHFLPSSGQWIQAEHAPSSCSLEVIESEEKVDEDQARKEAISKLILKSEQDFSKPPIKMVLFKGSGLLVLALHHALYDGVSLSNLFAIAKDTFNDKTVPNTPSFLQIARDYNSSEEKATSYWVKRLTGVENNWFVKERAINAKSEKAWRDFVQFSEEETEKVRGFNRRYKTSTQALGQVTFACTLNEFCQNHPSDTIFCQVVSGRTRKGADQVIGPTFNTIAIRVDLRKDDEKAKEVVQRVQAENNQSLQWQHAPLRNVQKGLNRTSLSDALFLYQPAISETSTDSTDKSALWTLVTSTAEQGSTQFTLNLELHDSEETLNVRASCASDVLSQSELKEILQLYKARMLSIVQCPNMALSLKSSNPKTNGIHHITNAHMDDDVDYVIHDELIRILCEVLHVNSSVLKANTNLSSIGLDSIAAMQISSRVRKQEIGSISPMDILQCGTIRDLAKATTKEEIKNENASFENTSFIRPPERITSLAKKNLDQKIVNFVDAYLPTAGMRYLFSGWQRSGGRQFQICIGRKIVEGKRLNVKAIQRSWYCLFQRHVILRSTIVPSGDDSIPLVLFIAGKNRWSGLVDVKDKKEELQHLSIDEQNRFAKQFGRSLLQSPPSIQAPSSRLTILQLPNFDAFFVQMPHTHYDAFTVPKLLNELWQGYIEYDEETKDQGVDIQDDLTSIESYLADCVLGSIIQKQDISQVRRQYWQTMLGKQHQPHIWTDRISNERIKESAHTPVHYFIRERRQDTPTVRQLQDRSQQLGLTPAALLTSTWAHVHAWQMQKTSSTFAFVHSGRFTDSIGLQETFCPTINLVPTHVQDLCPIDFDEERLRTSIIEIAQKLQKQWSTQPAWSIQSTMKDIHRWVTDKNLADQPSILNTTLNVQIRPSQKQSSLRESVHVAQNGDGSKQERDIQWSPLPLQAGPQPPHGDRGWSQEELKEFKIPKLFLNDGVCDPSVRIDIRMVVAASQVENSSAQPEQKIVLEAEVAREVLSRQKIDLALSQWAQLLRLIVN